MAKGHGRGTGPGAALEPPTPYSCGASICSAGLGTIAACQQRFDAGMVDRVISIQRSDHGTY